MEQKQSEMNDRFEDIISSHYLRIKTKHDYSSILKIMFDAYNLDRSPAPVILNHSGNRFEIENSGKPFLSFETEAHIVDDQNPGCTIIVKSGYSTMEETNEYANKILKILNDGSL